MTSSTPSLEQYDFDAVIDRRSTDSSKWNRLDPDVLPMFVADIDFRAPEPILRALHERVDHGLFGYPRVVPELLETIQAHLRDRYSWSVETEAITPLPGVIPGYNLAVKALTEAGDGVLVQGPAYPPIYNAPAHHGLIRQDAEMHDGGEGYRIDWDVFEAAAARSKVFLHCNPHNPTGRVFDRSELERMAEICLRHEVAIVADEIHCDVVYGGRRHIPIASLDPEVERRTVTLMAPSKTFGLPGLKASFGVIPNEELRERFEGSRAGLVPSVNILGQTAMAAAYRECGSWRDAFCSYLEGNIALLTEFIDSSMPGVRYSPPEGTYLAWLDCREAALPGDDPRTFFLENARVGLSDGLDFGTAGRGFARICFASPRSILREALERMSEALADR